MKNISTTAHFFEHPRYTRSLKTLSDDEIVKIINCLCFGYLQVNSREVVKIQTSCITSPEEETLYMRITTRTHPSWEGELPQVDQIFGLEFTMDDLQELCFTPMNVSVYTEKGLSDLGITHDFAEHRFNLNRFYDLLFKDFKIWNNEYFTAGKTDAVYPDWHDVRSELIRELNQI